jgi:hypothetical protein
MHQGDSSSKLLECASTQKTLNFEYGILDNETRMVVQKCTNEIKALMRRTSQDIIDIGQKLIEVKEHLGHGNFINWLKSEFNWSVSTATKFMQVGAQFKFVNFTNLNITASALYLIAAPSTPKQARAEVLERASLGENISYSKAKAIVCQYKKTAKYRVQEPVTVDVPTKTTQNNSCESTESVQYSALSVYSGTDNLIEEKAEIEMCSLSLPDSLPSTAIEDKQIVTTIEDIDHDNLPISSDVVKLTTISWQISNTLTSEIASRIKDLSPEQLALVITESARTGLSDRHLKAIITASQYVLYCRNQTSLRSI